MFSDAIPTGIETHTTENGRLWHAGPGHSGHLNDFQNPRRYTRFKISFVFMNGKTQVAVR